MAAVRGVVIEGLDELQDTLLNVTPREANALLKRVTLSIAEGMAAKMRTSVPVRTGKLRDAIVAQQGKQRPNKPSAEVIIQSGKGAKRNAFYWHFVEFGTRHMKAEPFIVPSVESERPQVQQKFREGFGQELERTLARKAKRK